MKKREATNILNPEAMETFIFHHKEDTMASTPSGIKCTL
jgi:hypothetical protein